jgi:hypothetical protein
MDDDFADEELPPVDEATPEELLPEARDDAPEEIPDEPHLFAYRRTAQKIRESFPATPGVYLMKDSQGRVIYIGKATSLRSRAGSYFLAAARREFRTSWVTEI